MPREGMEGTEYVSGHRFRRTARRKERKLEKERPGNQYRVIKTTRGPDNYQVRKVVESRLQKPPQARRER